MILKALYDLAHAEHLVDDPDFVTAEVAYCLSIGRDGSNPRILSVATEKQEGKRTSVECPSILIPREPSRQGTKAPALFLLDKASFLFGLDPSEIEPRKLARFKQEAMRFRALTAVAKEAITPGTMEHDALSALLTFLESPDTTRHGLIRAAFEEAPTTSHKKLLTSKLIYIVFGPEGQTPIHLLPEIRKYWRKSRELRKAAGQNSRCLVTGAFGPIAHLHTAIKGIPGAQSSGVPLVSFNKDSFKSLDLLGNDNAPIGQEAAEAYSAALNRLLSKRPLTNDGRQLQRQNLPLSSDTAAVFWSRKPQDLSWLLSLNDSPDTIKEMLLVPFTGRMSALDDPAAFYTLIVSGAEGRIVVRSFIETQTQDAAKNVLRYLNDASVDRPFGLHPGTYPLRQLLQSLAALGDIDRLPPGLATAVYLAAISGRSLPRIVLDAAVRRNRVEGAGPSRPNSDEEYQRVLAFTARCSLIRLYLLRPPFNQEQLAVSLDPNNRQPPYLLGRLLAILDAIQRDVNPKINTTIVDRFYGSASSTPMVVFPTLLRLNQHHLGKLRKEKAGLAVRREQMLQDAMSGLANFPRTMALEAQGLFALGFHHQRQALFTRKNLATAGTN